MLANKERCDPRRGERCLGQLKRSEAIMSRSTEEIGLQLKAGLRSQ
jgi:hypothetical protein